MKTDLVFNAMNMKKKKKKKPFESKSEDLMDMPMSKKPKSGSKYC